MTDLCRCGSGRALSDCCAPVVSGQRLAATAEELMRSRYTAFVLGEADHLWRSWHPSTRPADVVLDPSVVWTGLQIHRTEAGEIDDQSGTVEFTASFRGGELHEVSRFAKRAGRWFYRDGEVS